MVKGKPIQAWLDLGQGEIVPINQTLSFGRLKNCDLYIPESGVSRRHAIVQRNDNGEYWLIDLGSRNGTSLNRKHLTSPAKLSDGDVIEVGKRKTVFRKAVTENTVRVDDTQSLRSTSTYVVSADYWLLVVDVVGSTALSARHSEIEYADLMGAWMRTITQAIQSHNGAINKYLGDGVLAYWRGSPEAGDSILSALHALQRLQHDANVLDFRVVVHFGPVALGREGALVEKSLSGLNVGFVFRMENVAKSLGQRLLISEYAQRKLGQGASLVDLGKHEVENAGVSAPVRFFSLSQELSAIGS